MKGSTVGSKPIVVLIARLGQDERVRFLAVGATNTLVGYLLFASFYQFVFHDIAFGYILSLVFSYCFSTVLAFVLYRRFVFRVTGHIWRDFARFLGVNLLAVGINLVSLPFLVEVAGLSPLISQALILVCTTLVSFLGHKSVSFRRTDAEAVPPTTSTPAS
jgi:putative flippase GtrA